MKHRRSAPWEARYLMDDNESVARPRDAHRIITSPEWTGDDDAHRDEVVELHALRALGVIEHIDSPDILCGLVKVRRPWLSREQWVAFPARFPATLGDVEATFIGVRAAAVFFDERVITLELWVKSAELAAKSRFQIGKQNHHAVTLEGLWRAYLDVELTSTRCAMGLVDVVYGDEAIDARDAWSTSTTKEDQT